VRKKIKFILNNPDQVNFYEDADKEKIIEFFCNNLERFYLAIDPIIKILAKKY
jgi:hypothetical protein